MSVKNISDEIYYFFAKCINFVKNIFIYKEELWHFNNDYMVSIMYFRKSIYALKNNLSENSLEVKETLNKKIAAMDKLLILLTRIINDDYYLSLPSNPSATDIRKIEMLKQKDVDQIIKILKGNRIPHNPKNENFAEWREKYFDGTGIENWW